MSFNDAAFVMPDTINRFGGRIIAFSGLRHAVKSYPIKRRNYPQWLAELSGVPSYRFCASREAEAWLQRLDQKYENSKARYEV